MTDESMPIEVVTTRTDGRLVVVVSGDLDISTSARLESAVLGDPGGDRPSAVTLDLSEVGFIDSVGLRTLVRCRNGVDELVLRTPSGVVRRLLSLTRTTGEFTVEDGGSDR